MGQHENTFEKGMTSDVSVVYQPNGTYRYMKNCQLISQDGENYVIKDCLGNTLIFSLNIPFLDYGVTTPLTLTRESYPMAIGFISFPNKLVVLSSNNETDGGGYGEIGILNYNPYGQGIQPISVAGNDNDGYVPLYGHKDLNFSLMHRIEGFAYEESDDIQRVYWTDNNNEPRVFNVGDSMFTTYISSGSIVNGTQYMVVEGVIEYPVGSGTYYGPSNGTSNITTNVFTGGATANYTSTSGGAPTPKVIEYYPLQLLNFTPSRSVGNIKFKEYGAGSVYCGTKIYFYRLSKPSEGIYTSWSYGSSPVHVGTENSITAAPANLYFDFTGGGSSSALLNSQRSVVITIDNIDTNFTNIEVAVAEFDQSLEVIRIINIIANDAITGTSMDIEHSGSDNLGELTLSDITLFPASILKCKTITTNKNYILIANITERSELNTFDESTITISQIQHKIPVHEGEFGAIGSAQVCSNILSYDDISPSTNSNPANVDGIPPYTSWVVTTGIATYNAVAYGPAQPAGMVFTGVPGVYNWANTSGTAVVRPCVTRNRYTTTALVNKADYIQFTDVLGNNTAPWTYKNPAVASHVKGYWTNQTYRFGILFYDLKGNPFFVRWIGDFTTDNVDNVPLMEYIQVNSGGDDWWYINQNGIRISGIQIGSDIIDRISGFSIVRAERDATIMAQGMVMQTGASAPTGGIVYPGCGPDIQNCEFENQNDRIQLYTYICPDKLVDYPVQNYIPGSDLVTSHWYRPRLLGGSSFMKSTTDGGEALETKYFEQLAAETTGPPDRTYPIVAITDVSEGASVTNFGTLNYAYHNIPKFNNGPITAKDTSCYAGIVYLMNKSQAVGGPRTLIEVSGDVYGYDLYTPSQVWYGDLAAAYGNLDYKMIANVKVNKDTLYGGTSDTALANTFYISTGHFQPITDQVKTDTETSPGSGVYEFNNIDVWGGDRYGCLVDYGHSLFNDSLTNTAGNYISHSWGIKFPCECNSNYDLKRGRSVGGNKMCAYDYVGNVVTPTTAIAYSPAQLEGFSYNKGYSSTGLPFVYPALPANYISTDQFKFRIRYAGEKFPGEISNSFRTFNALDFKDTDGQGGEINNLKTQDGRTVVWQNRIISTVPILERQILSGTDGEPTTLGTGGVVTRFDPVNSYFGNQHQWGLTETEYGFFWFDMRRKACVVLSFSEGVQEVSQVEGLKGYFDEVFLEILGNTSLTTNVINSPTFAASSDRPLLGVGITGAYDPKFKMTYLTFKYHSRESFLGGKISNINKDFTVGYYHPAKMFIGFFDWTPSIAHTHNQTMFSMKNPQMKTKYYGADMQATTFEVGDIVKYLNAEYICISDVTIASYPGTAAQVPNYIGSLYWYKINQTNQIWAHNQPISLGQNPAPDYEYSKFFGQVVDSEVTIIVNPQTQNSFSVLNIEQHGNNENVTDIYTETQYDTAQDTDITSTNRYYRWVYDKICSSLPLSSVGSRLTDMYLKIRFYKKNWDTVPYTRTRNPKIFEALKSFFEEKR